MAEHVEARSLSSLNYLAANPPQYPSNPTEQRQDPLTLYISRVPGSRDVILSTQKPQVKNVTADDVARSFYYVHFNHPEDELLVPPGHSHSPSPRSSSERPRTPNQISRKPLPVTNNVPESFKNDVSDPATAPPPVPAHGVPLEHQASSQQPQAPEASPAAPAQGGVAAPIARKPVGPNAVLAKDLPPLPQNPMPTNLPPRPVSIDFADPDTNFHAAINQATPASRSPSPNKRPFTPFSLTIIRRDPTSGQQWNIGRVTSMQPADTPESAEDGRPESKQEPAPAINIHLETSGYSKFRGMPLTRPSVGSLDFPRPSFDARPPSAGAASLSAPADSLAALQAADQGGFDRQVMMVYSPSFATNFRNIFNRRSSRDGGDRSRSPATATGRVRGNSVASVGSHTGDGEANNGFTTTQPGPGLKARGYAFMSPWDGRCEFQTGNAGRSLRCKHVLPQLNGNVFNPLVGGGDDDAGPPKPKDSHAVSELRFNLPSSELFGKEKRPVDIGGSRARDQIQSQFNKILHQRNRSQTDTEDDDDFLYDMALGKEKAGGGNRGSRAKMGKLIIAEDGLKMLDLTIAANIGVWWTVWERTAWNS